MFKTKKLMKKLLFTFGLILISFPIIGGLFYGVGLFILFINPEAKYSVRMSHFQDLVIYNSPNTPIFLGLCGLTGAYLLFSLKSSNLKG